MDSVWESLLGRVRRHKLGWRVEPWCLHRNYVGICDVASNATAVVACSRYPSEEGKVAASQVTASASELAAQVFGA